MVWIWIAGSLLVVAGLLLVFCPKQIWALCRALEVLLCG